MCLPIKNRESINNLKLTDVVPNTGQKPQNQELMEPFGERNPAAFFLPTLPLNSGEGSVGEKFGSNSLHPTIAMKAHTAQ